MPTELRRAVTASILQRLSGAACLAAAVGSAATSPASAQGQPGARLSTGAAAASSGAATPARRADVTLRGGAFVGKDRTVTLRQGEAVQLVVDSDRPLTLHFHGYELTADVGPGRAGTFAFVARIAGRFPVHQHSHGPDNHRAVFFVEVHP